jgi:murein L,D-transpeptidase YafK
MKLHQADFLLFPLAIFVPFVAQADAASKSWHPETVAAREAGLAKEFEERGLKLGSPVFLRVYKRTSEMELWVQHGPRYVLFKTYGICRWSGRLGPKFYEGDRQSPEGLYRITASDLIVNARWDRAMNINYPNKFDHLNGRGGSGILIHGGCGSIGCFAIKNENVEDVYGAVRAALRGGQAYVPVLALPFRFSALAPDKEDTLYMSQFWADLRRADLLFERDRLPPVAWICDGRYLFSDRRGDRHRHAVHLPGCRPLYSSSGRRKAKSRAQQTPDTGAAAETPQLAAVVTPLRTGVSRPEPVEPVVQTGGGRQRQRRTQAQTQRTLGRAVRRAGALKIWRGGLMRAAPGTAEVCPRAYPRRSLVALKPRRPQCERWKSAIVRVRVAGALITG